MSRCEVQKAFSGKDLNRDQKTQLVNQAVQKDSKGNYTFDLECQAVKMVSSYKESTKGEQKAVGLPKALMVAKLGSEAKLEQAIRDGEISQCTQGGKMYYVFNTVTVTKKTEAQSSVHAERKDAASDEALQSMNAFADHFLPNFGFLAFHYVSSCFSQNCMCISNTWPLQAKILPNRSPAPLCRSLDRLVFQRLLWL